METKLKTSFACIATLGIVALSNLAFSESAQMPLPSRPQAPPASPAFTSHESAWAQDAPEDTRVQLNPDWVALMGEALEDMAEIDQEFAIKAQLRTRLTSEGQEVIAEVIARTDLRRVPDTKTDALASN